MSKYSKCIDLFAKFATIIVAAAAVTGLYLSLTTSQKTLGQSEKFYELENKPIITFINAGWRHISQTLAGDSGLRCKVDFLNFGKSPTTNAKLIQDIILKIDTNMLEKFPLYTEDMSTVSKEPDSAKEKRLHDYGEYRQKPFRVISDYIIENKGKVSPARIKEYFDRNYQDEGYIINTYGDLQPRYIDVFMPRIPVSILTGRSMGIEDLDKKILEKGGDLLILYYAIEYEGPLSLNKYIIHYIFCYDSSDENANQTWDDWYRFTKKKSFSQEIPLERRLQAGGFNIVMNSSQSFFSLYVKPILQAFWPSFIAVILALLIDRTRLPRLKVYADKQKIVNTYHEMGTWRFIRLIVANETMPCLFKWLKRQVAQNCSATFEFFDSRGKSLFIMRGRWANTPEIPHVGSESQRERTLFPDPISIFAGDEEPLDCIVQQKDDTVAYGWNNEAYFHNWKTPHYKLNVGKYKVKVRIITQNGVSITKVFNLTVDKNFEITKLD